MQAHDPWREIISKSALIGKDIKAEKAIIDTIKTLLGDDVGSDVFLKVEPALYLLLEHGSQFSAQEALGFLNQMTEKVKNGVISKNDPNRQQLIRTLFHDYVSTIQIRNPHPYFLSECGEKSRHLLYAMDNSELLTEAMKQMAKATDELSYTTNGKSTPGAQLFKELRSVVIYCSRKLMLGEALPEKK